jgi:hypothetical protein
MRCVLPSELSLLTRAGIQTDIASYCHIRSDDDHSFTSYMPIVSGYAMVVDTHHVATEEAVTAFLYAITAGLVVAVASLVEKLGPATTQPYAGLFVRTASVR